MSLPDTFHLFPGGEPVAVTVTATALPEAAERAGMVTYLGEVCIGSHPVFGYKMLTFAGAAPGLAERRAQEQTLLAFAERLRGLFNYDPRAARGL